MWLFSWYRSRLLLVRLTPHRGVAGIRHSSGYTELGQHPLHHDKVRHYKTDEANPFRHR
jgi:hypothetical protein